MNLFRSVRTVAGASGDSILDWEAAASAAKSSTPPGELALAPEDRQGYASDVTDARTAIQETAEVDFVVPDTIEIQNRHHWIDANSTTFERVMGPIEQYPGLFPGVARTINTGTMTVLLSFLGRNVLGQYDPLLLAEQPSEQHALYFVHPNIQQAADSLSVDTEQFRRWIAFHEVTHAAEFGAAPWLTDYLEERLESGIEALAAGSVDREAFRELDATMTVIEGYAELLMDRAFDEDATHLREKIDQRRRGRGPLQQLLRRLLGLNLKRRQYERGRAFFEAIAAARDLETATLVWEDPAHLPSSAELDEPSTWLRRVAA